VLYEKNSKPLQKTWIEPLGTIRSCDMTLPAPRLPEEVRWMGAEQAKTTAATTTNKTNKQTKK
jgi:hypothetical protein